jgi:hypothetical protein
MTTPRRWARALAEHDRVVRNFLEAVCRVEAVRWHQPPAPGKWSPAELTLHVCEAYAFGRDAARGGPGMRLRVPPAVAWASRLVLLPLSLVTRQFPRGADAPAEVVPDPEEAGVLTPQAAVDRLRVLAAEAAAALQHAPPGARLTHAYFGPLSPYATLRLLSAHTRHHARGLAPRPR